MKKLLIYLAVFTIIFLPTCSAAHYIIGTVENAKDGTEANGHTILLWNPAVGIQDNLSDIIGPSGNSGTNNNYTIDCELLQGGCSLDNILSLRVIDNGDNYLSEEQNVTVSSGTEDYVENITLNSPPTTELIFPYSFSNISTNEINFNCSASDLDNNLKEISLYGNWTGVWELNETKEINAGGFTTFTKNIAEGFYEWTCKVTDNLSVSSFSSQNNTFTVFYLADLSINSASIQLNESNPVENQSIMISALVENLGGADAENVLVSFFEGDPDSSGQSIGNVSINISADSSTQADIPWKAKMGKNNIFVIADYSNSIEEGNESNNKANKTFSINSWQYIFGNVSIDKIIGDSTLKIKKWFNESTLAGNIFITDSESSVNWLSLQAIGKTKSGGDSSHDFLDIDELLDMTYFEDSVSNIFSNNQNPKNTESIIIHQKEIQEVPIINSTDNSNFITGILWDTSDDTGGPNGEFDSVDKEDLVFVSPINKQTLGKYGTYDYEIRIPSKLREYNQLDSKEIYLYYDLN